MGKVYNLFSTQEPSPTYHSLDSASDLLTLIRRYTAEAVRRTESLSLQLQYLAKDSGEYKRVCKEYDEAVVGWAERVHRLGALAKGLWLVDFDTGRGYLCWAYPEPRIEYFHEYNGSYKTRKRLSELPDMGLLSLTSKNAPGEALESSADNPK